MNAKKSGIRGRLEDLGTIDQKYDIAISTAAFSQLESILVETVEDAEKCIAFLKAKKLGRANFIILTEMDRYKAEMNKPFQCPEQTEGLFDKIKTQSEYSTAFYQALKNTLVAKDLEIANKAAYGKVRYRVVTLSGELVEISGAMSGGGKPRQGSMSNQKIKDEQEIAKICEGLKSQIDQKRAESQSLQEKKKDLEKEINSLNLTMGPIS